MLLKSTKMSNKQTCDVDTKGVILVPLYSNCAKYVVKKGENIFTMLTRT